MLRLFAVENFRSLRDRQELSFETVTGVRELNDTLLHDGGAADAGSAWLPSLILYGRNASGKSAALLALLALKGIVRSSGNATLHDKIGGYTPHLLDPELRQQPTSFEVDFVAHDELRYVYQISYTAHAVERESLYVHRTAKRSLVFDRTGSEGSSVQFGPSIIGPKAILKTQLLPNQLVLSKGANSNFDALIPAYSFIVDMKFAGFRSEETMTYDVGSFTDGTWYMDGLDIPVELVIANRPNEDPELLHFLERVLDAADTSISGIRVSHSVNTNEEGKQTGHQTSVFTRHSASDRDVEFPLRLESQGTQRMLALAVRLYDTFKNGSLLVIDEVDRSLHSAIVRFMFTLFGDPAVNRNRAQLIASAHDVALLDSVLFRRDQIVFVEKVVNATTLYTLSDIRGVKPTMNIRELYLAGRFGAYPMVGPAHDLMVETKDVQGSGRGKNS